MAWVAIVDQHCPRRRSKRVKEPRILSSGTGTNLQEVPDATDVRDSDLSRVRRLKPKDRIVPGISYHCAANV